MADRKHGERIVFTPEQIEDIEGMAAYLTVEQIADRLGIARSTFFDKCHQFPEVRAAYDRGRANKIVHVAGKLMELVDKENIAAIIFFLKTQGGWKETARVEHDVAPEVKTLADFYADITKGDA